MRKIIQILLFTALVQHSQAGGSEGSGGGDLCEQRIQEIRDDILNWILRGGPKAFQNPYVQIEHYSSQMLEVLSVKKDSNGVVEPKTQIECIYEPIKIQNIEKTCRFDSLKNVPKITCNAEVFMNKNIMSVDSQYQLIHHEYAGIAGLETPFDSQSQYLLSKQIASFLENQLVRKLAVKPNQSWQVTNNGAMIFHHYLKVQDGLTSNGYDIFYIRLPKILGNDGNFHPLVVEEDVDPTEATNIICRLFNPGMYKGGPTLTTEVGPQETFLLNLAGTPATNKPSFWNRKKYYKITEAKCDLLVGNGKSPIRIPYLTVK